MKEENLLYNTSFRQSLKTFFAWIVGPRHSVNYFYCAV